ncbi:vacuolar protein sorting-associated protein 26 [Tasmannia lanceolata]|uniref:vacuolar protein sorting-associated protein 26 n=1 Tax=Tasmannia lanceolata TaxID=3420 RepID=UPI0040632A98
MSIELKLSRASRVYRPSEPLQGKIIADLAAPISHQAIRVTATGTVNLQVRGGMTGVIESLYNVAKPISIMSESTEIMSSGRLGAGRTEIPFSMIIGTHGHDGGKLFYETFHGANISIQYLITAEITRGYLHKSLSATMEFIVESAKANLMEAPVSPEMVNFHITPDTQRHPLLPELISGGFQVTGNICTRCSLSDPVCGDLTVEASAIPIHSIDLQLLRVESIIVGERIVTETSVVQTTQIADGDVCRSMTLPVYVIIPRLLTCPTVLAGPFSIEFQVSIIITFQSELSKLYPKSDLRTPRLWLAMETLPLRLFRTK